MAKNKSFGTPKDLRTAIGRELIEYLPTNCMLPELAKTIEAAVKDRLAQDFGAIALLDESGNVLKLWNRIFPKGDGK